MTTSRPLRAVLGNALTWGVAWGAGITLVAGTMKLLGVAPADARWLDAIGLGVRGGVVGAAASLSFSLLLRVGFRGRDLRRPHWLPVGLAGGVAAGVFVPLFLQFMNVLSGDGPVAWGLVRDDAVLGFVFGAVASAGTLLVAQRTTRGAPEAASPSRLSPGATRAIAEGAAPTTFLEAGERVRSRDRVTD